MKSQLQTACFVIIQQVIQVYVFCKVFLRHATQSNRFIPKSCYIQMTHVNCFLLTMMNVFISIMNSFTNFSINFNEGKIYIYILHIIIWKSKSRFYYLLFQNSLVWPKLCSSYFQHIQLKRNEHKFMENLQRTYFTKW